MKRLILLFLLIASFAWADGQTAECTYGKCPGPYELARMSQGVLGSQAAAAPSCASCNSTNDASLGGFTDAATGNSNGSPYYAFPFTIAATKCVTGVTFSVTDAGGTGDRTAKLEIWTDNAGKPGSIVGAGYTKELTDLPDTRTDTEFLFASCQTLAAGSYWAVYYRTGSDSYFGYLIGGSGWYGSSDGTNWTLSEGDHGRGWVLGCDPS